MASNTISHTVQAKSDEATDSSDGTISLRNSLEGLPQELYDEIYRLTFTADAKVRVYTDEPTNLRYAIAMEYAPHPIYGPGAPQHKHMTRDERPPANLLAVSRSSRLQFAKSFFGQDSIIVLCGEYGVRELYKFIAPEHMPLLRLYVSEIFGTDNGEKWTRMTLHYKHPSPPPERIFLSGLEKAVKLEFGFETNDPCSSNYPKPAGEVVVIEWIQWRLHARVRMEQQVRFEGLHRTEQFNTTFGIRRVAQEENA